jgi:hypothetical protein
VRVGGLMLKPLLAFPLPLRSLPMYSISSLRASSACPPLVLAPVLAQALVPVRALAQALARTQTQTQTSNLNSKLAALASAILYDINPAASASGPVVSFHSSEHQANRLRSIESSFSIRSGAFSSFVVRSGAFSSFVR